jgi:predicted DNA-binding transcriptional regulator AlpA
MRTPAGESSAYPVADPQAPGPHAGTGQTIEAERLLRLPQVLEAVGIGRTGWLEMVRSGEAPKPIRIGRAVAWPASEVQAFIRERIRISRGARA